MAIISSSLDESNIPRSSKELMLVDSKIIAEEKIKVKDLVESAVYKLRKHVEQVEDSSDEDEIVGDDFENLYKGEISKSGVPILPSKRVRKIPEKILVSKDDLSELQNTIEQPTSDPVEEAQDEEADVSLDEMKDQEDTVSDETENQE